jgi:parallel beta-helix repeat protein
MYRFLKISSVYLYIAILQCISCSGALIAVEGEHQPVQNSFPSNQDVYDLQATRYRSLIEGFNYTKAINQAIKDAHQAGGGIILFPGNTTVEISEAIIMQNKISFASSTDIATIKCTRDFKGSQMITIPSKDQLSFYHIRFDGNEKANGIASYGKNNKNINIQYCEFVNFKAPYRRGTGIALQNTSLVHIDHCLFKNSDFGIRFDKRNSDIYIDANTFEGSLTKNPLRIQGNSITSPEDQRAYSDNVWIRNNNITIGRGDSIIDELDILTRDPQTGAVDIYLVNGTSDPDYKTYADWRKGRFGPSAIYLTCSNKESDDNTGVNYHRNVVVEDNVVDGPDYGFYDGGSADLYSLKDIDSLHCKNNIARNSGDIGFSIERSKNVTVSHNTANRNNAYGIAFSYVENGMLSNNLCKNNGLRRNLIYNVIPYGGILISGFSRNNIIKDNYLMSDSITKVSQNKDVPRKPYLTRNIPSDFYGILLKVHNRRENNKIVEYTPSFNTIEANQFEGLHWGAIYNQSESLQVKDCFSSTARPENLDYPLHTLVLNSNPNYSVAGWKVVFREETKLKRRWDGNDSKIKLALSNSTIQKGDVVGIVLDNKSIYWTHVDETSWSYDIKLKTHTSSIGASTGAKVIVLRWQDQVE